MPWSSDHIQWLKNTGVQIQTVDGNALAFDGMLILGAVTELVDNAVAETGDLVEKLKKLQKRLKYGLVSVSAISFHELGFSDRVISTEMSEIWPDASTRARCFDKRRHA